MKLQDDQLSAALVSFQGDILFAPVHDNGSTSIRPVVQVTGDATIASPVIRPGESGSRVVTGLHLHLGGLLHLPAPRLERR